MGNMSYCRFENTYQDLEECYEALQSEQKQIKEALKLSSKSIRKAIHKKAYRVV